MALRPDEVTDVLKRELQQYRQAVDVAGVGTVLQVSDGVARVYGLAQAMAGELLEFTDGVLGMALNLEEDNVAAVILGPDEGIREGDQVKTTGRIVQVPVGKELLGRVVNALGTPVDGKGPLVEKEYRPIEALAPTVVERENVCEPLQTGLKAIDSMIPIGRGQRELIIGDRQTGKTAIAIDTILNQRDTDVYCIYVAIGQKQSNVRAVVDVFEKHGAMDYTIVIAATANDPAPEQYLAPYAGCAMGEWFRDNGMHCLIIYDDLSKHAQSYREVSLLLRRPPGREAYPGDVFNLHSRLLERAAKMHRDRGGGSLTALPVIETQAGDYSAYIPTNVISITDGQIYLEPDLFYKGVRPAVNVGISVSRVGGDAQTKMMKKVAGSLRLDLAQYRELEAFAEFASDLDAITKAQLARGARLTEILKQVQYQPMSVVDQTIAIFAGVRGLVDDIKPADIQRFQAGLLTFIADRHPEVCRQLKDVQAISDELSANMERVVRDFKERFQSGAEAEAIPAPGAETVA